MIPQPAPSPPSPRTPSAAVGPVVACFLLLVGVVAALGLPNYRVAADQDLFHLPVIRQFAAEWPRPTLSNYASATAPGYHLLLAIVQRYAHPGVIAMRAVGGVFGVLLVGLLARAALPRSAWLAMPLAASVYVLSSTVWLLPENAAWLLLAVVLVLALSARGTTLLVGSAVALALLVFVRQSHAWAALPFVAAAAFECKRAARTDETTDAAARAADSSALRTAFDSESATRAAASGLLQLSDPRARPSAAKTAAFVALALLPMLAVLGWLVWLWHGLVPPAFRPGSGVELPLATKAGGLAPAAAGMTLALVGLFGAPLLAWLLPPADPRRVLRWAAVGLAVGFVLGVLPESTYSPDRRSGLWNLVQKLPTVADRSPLFVGLSALGGGVAAVALARLPGRRRAVLATALLGFAFAQTANASVWQRYYEPFVLIWLPLAAAWPTPMTRARKRFGIGGLIALVAFQFAVTAYVLSRGG